MPYETRTTPTTAAPDHSGAVFANAADQTIHQILLWPHRSLPAQGFVWFIAVTALLISLPLFALLGSPAVWGLLPFVALAVAAMWWALQRNYRDREITEHLTIGSGQMTLVRIGPRGMRADWQANPYWVTPVLHKTGGPVPDYITLRGGDREVELGSFLSQEERRALHGEVADLLRRLR